MALRSDGQETSSERRRVGKAETASFKKAAAACSSPTSGGEGAYASRSRVAVFHSN